MTRTPASRNLRITLAVTLVLGVGMRVFNAFAYERLWGFDARFNWAYVQYLTRTWRLPEPEALWSAAHPPLFYYVSAALLRMLGNPGPEVGVVVLRLVGTLAGLATIALAVVVVRRIAPDEPWRALLAAGLLLFLPVHVYMSAMLTEEIVSTFFISLALSLLALGLSDPERDLGTGRVALIGAVCGLALLTKLTGLLAGGAVCGALLFEAWRRAAWRWALLRIALVVGLVTLIGGWFYLRNWILYGYLYPHGLEIHRVMFTMPPGVRFVSDYLSFPLAVWTNPQLLDPDLLRSIWGSTYVTLWFDGHRAFLPYDVPRVDRVGGVLLALGLLPTAAFLVGVARGLRRVFERRSTLDVAFLLLLAAMLVGYVLFTWRNPFFAVLKASFLLGLSVPFAFYASEVLADWIARPGGLALGLKTALIVGAVLVSVTFTQTRLLWNMDHMRNPGLIWATYDPRTGEVRGP